MNKIERIFVSAASIDGLRKTAEERAAVLVNHRPYRVIMSNEYSAISNKIVCSYFDIEFDE